MSMYQLFTNKEENYEVAEPSNKAAKDYAKLMIKCAPKSMQERLELANQFGWDAKEVKDEIFYEDYQRERASILFPHIKSEIKKNVDFLNVSEVDKAEGFFTKATGLALNEPSLSLSELSRFLTQLHTQAQKVDVSLTDSRETKAER